MGALLNFSITVPRTTRGQHSLDVASVGAQDERLIWDVTNQSLVVDVVRLGSSIVIAALLVLTVGISISILVAAEGGPTIGFTNHTDGDWYSSPQILVEGWARHDVNNLSMNMTELGYDDLSGVRIVGDQVVFRAEKYWGEEFAGPTLDTDKWEFVYTGGYIQFNSGYLYISGTYQGGYDIASLIRSKGPTFPDSPAAGWSAEFRMTYYNPYDYEMGGGITNGSTEVKDSLMAAYMDNLDYGWLRAYTDGDEVYNVYNNHQRWRTYRLHSDGEGQFRLYIDDVNIANFTSSSVASHFWFGTNYPVMPNPYHGAIYIDYARVFALSGSWTSSVVDLGDSMVLDRIRPNWTSSARDQAKLDLWVQVSDDGVAWTDWVPLVGGYPAEDIMGRYFRYRVRMGFPSDAQAGQNIKLNGLNIDYHNPIMSIGYNHNGKGWVALNETPEWNFTLDLEEDENLIRVRVIDIRQMLAVAEVTLILDTTAPTGSIEINGGAVWCNDRNVILTASAHDKWGVVAVELSNDRRNLTWQLRPYCETLPRWIPAAQGMSYVYARFTDIHGIVSEVVQDGIMFDSEYPVSRVLIDGGTDWASSSQVSLGLEYDDINPISRIEISNSEDMSDPMEVPVGTYEVDWDLSLVDDGTATVYLRVFDIAGNANVVHDNIVVYFPKAEGTVVIEGDALMTNNKIVSLTIDVPTALLARLMQVSNDASFPGIEWEALVEEKLWLLSEGDGMKTVHVRFQDYRGIASLPVNSTIILDSTPPVVEVRMNQGAPYTTVTDVNLYITFKDTYLADQMWVSDSDDFFRVTSQDYLSILPWRLPAAEGTYTLYVKVTDVAGNAAIGSDSIRHTTLIPIVSPSIEGGSPTSDDESIVVVVDWVDEYGAILVQVGIDRDPGATDPWMDASFPITVPLPTGIQKGRHEVRMRARNLPGLESDVVSTPFELDMTPPTLVITSPVNGSKRTQDDRDVEVSLTIDDESDIELAEYRIDVGAWVSFLTDSRMIVIDMPTFGFHTVDVRVTDAAGNEALTSTEFTIRKPTEDSTPGFAAALAALSILGAALVVLRSHRRH